MLYISEIILSDGFTKEHSVPCIYYNSLSRMRYTIELALRDTNRPGISKLTNAPDIITIESSSQAQDDFEVAVKAHNPYGYVPDVASSPGITDAMLVAIDKPSLEFLECVDEVAPVTRPVLDSLVYHLRSLEHDFAFWDAQRSIVTVNPHANSYSGCTLFQGLCYAKLDWYKNRLFLRADPSDKCIWYEVLFNDVAKARALLSKAALKGYNPVAENLEASDKR